MWQFKEKYDKIQLHFLENVYIFIKNFNNNRDNNWGLKVAENIAEGGTRHEKKEEKEN